MTVAIMTAALAAFGNIVLAYVNGNLQRTAENERAVAQRELERSRSESTLILEMIKTGNDPVKASKNLQFLVDAGLISDPMQLGKLQNYLQKQKPGQGPSLPADRGGTASTKPAIKNCSEIAPRTRQIIAEHLGVPLKDIVDQKKLVDDFGADQLDMVQVTMALEDEFKMQVSDDVARGLTTVGNYIQVVQNAYPRLCGPNAKP